MKKIHIKKKSDLSDEQEIPFFAQYFPPFLKNKVSGLWIGNAY